MKAWLGGLGALGLLTALGLAVITAPPEPVPASSAVAPPALPALPRAIPAPAAPRLHAELAPVPSPSELDRLVATARQGDRRAAYAAYLLLSACVETACPGVPLSLVNERLRFLADAARAGVAGAQIDFYLEGPGAQQATEGDALQAWRQQALDGLKSAAAQCESFAMGQLATLFDTGELAARDATAAVAYAVADGQLRRRPPSDASLRDRLAEPISDAALAAARQQGLDLAAACH
jgi:hypothetical protein